MNKWLGRTLIAAGTAGMVYGVYLLAGTGWAVVLGSFVVYVAGYHLTLRRRADSAQASIRVSTSIQEARQAAHRRGMN